MPQPLPAVAVDVHAPRPPRRRTRRPPHVLAGDDLVVGVAGTILPAAGQLPVSRGSSAAVSSVHAARRTLEEGGLVVVHPEGPVTRDPDRWSVQARTGVARPAAHLVGELRGEQPPVACHPLPSRQLPGEHR